MTLAKQVKLLGCVLIVIVAYGLSLLALLPLDYVLSVIPARSPFIATLTHGSLVSGEAKNLRIAGIVPVDHPVDHIEWRWQPSLLLLGQLGWRVRMIDGDNSELRGSFAVSLDGTLRLNEITGTLPLQRLATWLRQPPYPLLAQLELSPLDLQLAAAGHLQYAAGEISILRGILLANGRIELGDFTVQVATKDAIVSAAMQDNGGPLALTANASLDTSGRYRISGHAATRAVAPPALSNLLGLLGPLTAGGQHRFDLSGQFSFK